MKKRKVQFKLKGKTYDYEVVTFDSLKEAQSLLGNELLNVINLGNAVFARHQVLGRNPFKPRKTKYKIDTSKLDEATIQKLKEAGALT